MSDKPIGSRWECLCCGRVARIIAITTLDYYYEFESDPGTRCISKNDAAIRFRPVGDNMETLRKKLERIAKK